MNKKMITLCSALTIATIFSACGGSSSTKKLGNKVDAKKADVEIVGRVMDGYIKDATVFFDENRNLIFDKDEPNAKTDEFGRFVLGLTKEQAKKVDRTHRVISLVDGIETDTGLPFTTSLHAVPTADMIKGTVYLTPLSTFLTYSAVNALKGNIKDIGVADIIKQLNQTFGLDVQNQINYIKKNNLNFYRINNILQKAKEISGISYDEFTKLLHKGITLEQLLAKLQKPNEIRDLKDFYFSVTQEQMNKKKANINKAVMDEINNKTYKFKDISIKDLPDDGSIKDPDDKNPSKIDKKDKTPDGSGGFTQSDFDGKIFSMHNEDGSIFMGLGRLEFADGKINGNIPYKIENGYLVLDGMGGPYKKTGEEDGKIYFEDINDSSKKFYFQKKDTSDDHNLVPQNGVLYSPFNKSATVFLDKNKNLVQDADEPSTTTDENGNFTIKVEQIYIDKKKTLVAINGKNAKGESTKDIVFKTMMGEDKIILNAFSSALTGLVYAITNNMVMQDLSHSNMIPSLTKNIGIEIDDLTADITKKPDVLRKAKKINAFIRALANTYNDDKAYGTHILEAYIHLFSNTVAGVKPNTDKFGLDNLIDRFNHQNKLVEINPEFKDKQKHTNIKTFEQLLKAINDEIEGGADASKLESYIEEAKKFRPKKHNIAQAWDANMQGVNPLPKDQFSKYQWHLKDQGAVVNTHGIYTVGGHDLNVMGLYEQGIVGKDAWVRVVDDGVEAEHEDLKGRINLENSWSAEKKSNNTTPKSLEDSHGTNVAGLIAADGSNKIGVKGVAPYATLTAYKLRTPQPGALDYTQEELKEAWLGGDKDKISVVNNSWGSLSDKYIEEEKFLKEGAENLRGGKGRIYLIASGNGGFNQRELDENGEIPDFVDDSATSYLRGSQYAITVAAIRNENIVTQYSAQGSNVLVSGYGGGVKTHTTALMTTTTRTGTSKTTWEEDSEKAYSFAFDGTSAATPVTSGALALVMSECPNLSYRDVKWLIAHTATKVDENYNGKTISGVKNVPPFRTTPKLDLHNGFGYVKNAAGLSHSNYYGYGLVNPTKMIEMCKANFISLPPKKEIHVTNVNTGLKPLNKNGHYLKEKIMVNPSDANGVDKVEWVGLTIYGKFDNLQKLSIVLISPSGTKSRILTNSKSAFDEIMKVEEGFRLSSVAFVDENPQGEWTVLAQSDDTSDTGRFTKLKLEVVGYSSKERK